LEGHLIKLGAYNPCRWGTAMPV